MGKTKKIIQCYQSPSGSRPPKCHQSPTDLCALCRSAMTHYNQVRAAKQASRRRKNRDAAKLSTMKKDEKFSDLLADNIALSMEYETLVKDLDDINTAKDLMDKAISSKVQEILDISVTKIT
jgi:hypothetical protein